MTEKERELKCLELAMMCLAAMPDEMKRKKLNEFEGLTDDGLQKAINAEAARMATRWKFLMD